MPKKVIYFDYNIFIEYIKNDEFKHSIDLLKNNYEYVYAPPYLEEVANIKGSEEQVDMHIDNIEKMFNCKEFLPTDNKGIVKRYEHPRDCYNRVIKFYELTKYAEVENNYFLSQRSLFNNIREEAKIKTIEINNIDSEKFFFDCRIKSVLERYPEFSDYYLFEDLWKSIKNNFKLIERNISNLFDILEVLGYYPEKEKTYISRIHDVSHSIYATQADYFITLDKNLERKCKAVYNLLNVPTKVLSYKKFSEMV